MNDEDLHFYGKTYVLSTRQAYKIAEFSACIKFISTRVYWISIFCILPRFIFFLLHILTFILLLLFLTFARRVGESARMCECSVNGTLIDRNSRITNDHFQNF